MRQKSLGKLQELVSDVIRKSGFSGDVSLSVDALDDTQDFIRVQVQMADLDRVSDGDLRALMSSIEGAVTRADDRFPSVRFSER